jgi:hypothetical protein
MDAAAAELKVGQHRPMLARLQALLGKQVHHGLLQCGDCASFASHVDVAEHSFVHMALQGHCASG